MREIIAEFNLSLGAEDLFQAWQNELRWRQQIRTMAYQEDFIIRTIDEFKFLQRSLYYGPRPDLFFEILFRSMTDNTVLICVLQSPSGLIRDFLNFLAHKVQKNTLSSKDLQFLINLYRSEYYADFKELVSHLDTGQCSYLLSRTGNNELRALLKDRQRYIAGEEQSTYYGLINSLNLFAEFPTIYGDKIKNMAAAAKALKAIQALDLSVAPIQGESAALLLKAMEMLFNAGLLADCLAILTRIVNHPGGDKHSPLLSVEDPYYQRIDSLLRKVLPMYSLLISPFAPHRYALELYRSLFPGFYPDTASLLYLDIHSIVMASLQGHCQYANFELAQKGGKILALRPNDLAASALLQSGNKMSSDNLSALEQTLKNRIPHCPHEVYVIMEVLRFWHREGRIIFDKLFADSLLNGYRQFFNWIPAAPFMNEQVLDQLGLIADDETRTACERIVLAMQESYRDDFGYKMPAGRIPDQEMKKLRQQLLLSKFMGVF